LTSDEKIGEGCGGYQREIKERAYTIKEKERMISDLRKKGQELEKFKFVLDYKINELDRQIKPREAMIETITTQMEEMNVEHDEYLLNNRQLELELRAVNLKLRATSEDEKKQQLILNEIDNISRTSHQHLKTAKDNINNPKKLKSTIKKIFQLYGSLQEVEGPSKTQERRQDDHNVVFQRRRDFLKQTSERIDAKLNLHEKKHEKTIKRYMQENTTLLNVLNELRVELADYE